MPTINKVKLLNRHKSAVVISQSVLEWLTVNMPLRQDKLLIASISCAISPMLSNHCLPVAVQRSVRGSKSDCRSFQLHPSVPCLTPRLGSSSLHNKWNANSKPIEVRERIAFSTSCNYGLKASSSRRLPAGLAWENAACVNGSSKVGLLSTAVRAAAASLTLMPPTCSRSGKQVCMMVSNCLKKSRLRVSKELLAW